MAQRYLDACSYYDPKNILLLEDNYSDIEIIHQLIIQSSLGTSNLKNEKYFSDALKELDKGNYDIILLDLNLPDSSGLENVSVINSRFPTLPIVVLTGIDDLKTALEALKMGAQDYLTKDQINSDILTRSIRYSIERKSSEHLLKEALAESHSRYEQLEKIAKHDFLTQLPNRSYFESVLHRNLHNAMISGKAVALLYLDLNGFKAINDTLGHEVGDELLKLVAQRLNDMVRSSDFVARLGGDEFVVLTDLLDYRSEVFSLVNRILKSFEQEFITEQQALTCQPSIGVAFYPEGPTPEILVKQADYAMYEAKEKRNVPVCFYTKKMRLQFSRTLQIQNELYAAIQNNEFDVHFQKVIDPYNKHNLIYEALLRWNSHLLGNIPPSEFIPVLENGPMADSLTMLALEKSAQLMRSLPKTNITIKINITAAQLSNPEFYSFLLQSLNKLDFPKANLCLELTETELVKNAERCLNHIKKLKRQRIRFALDDFGTGYSSLTNIINLPIDYLKIDRILIRGIDQDTRNQALIAGIIEMAHRLNMIVTAEGIESEPEYHVMQQLGCDLFQGFYFTRPEPLEALITSKEICP